MFKSFSAPSAFIETLRDRMFKPSLSTIIAENSKYLFYLVQCKCMGYYWVYVSLSIVASLCPRVAIVLASDPVCVAAKRMQELRVNSVIILAGNNIQGILTYAYCLIISLIDYRCFYVACSYSIIVFLLACLQFKGSSHASCGTKSSS